MTDLKSIFIFLLLFPAVSLAQTIHVNKDGEINYRGIIEIPGSTKLDLYQKAKTILLDNVNPNPDSLIENADQREIGTKGLVNISTEYQTIKKFRYRVKMQSKNEGIGYEISDVQLILGKRGKKPKTIPSSELVKGMEENGAIAVETEKVLNAIDMHIQKLIARMKSQSM